MLQAASQAASAWFASSQILQNYAVAGAVGATVSGPVFHVGPWKVQEASHKTTQKRASVWTCDKRNPEMERLGAGAKDVVIALLKMEVSSLGRLRHPCILEMVEPLEDMRNELVFATELLISSLALAIPMSSGGSGSSGVELDEIEIQKGILQLTKGLSFLHTSAKLVHSNLRPESVVLNATGDWKICGLGLTIPIMTPDGRPTPWEFPGGDSHFPDFAKRSFDYLAPEYVLDEQITPVSDFYSLGCVIYAVHAKGGPPFRNRGNSSSLRSNAGRLEGGDGLRGMETWDKDLQALIASLVTARPAGRLTAETLTTHSYFSSLAISTLNFLDRSNFASRTREEKAAFMKGLHGVLGRFSEGLKRRKILPSLLDEMKDPSLLSSILPNVFEIASTLDPSQFQAVVLPSLKPLFSTKDPPIVMMVLLENLETLQSKTTKAVFRTDVLPLVYYAMESEHAMVQERALLAVPGLCETIDYAEVQSVLFPRVALVFTKTRILSVKVSTLNCFVSMVKTLDQGSLTQKLVPLLSKIRTKEPAVMMATLQVHEAMGLKVEREAVATLVLPQLWSMSVGPLLSVGQFERFMQVIKVIGARIEREHGQYLRDAQRHEDKNTVQTPGITSTATGTLNFASLVAGQTVASPFDPAPATVQSNGLAPQVSWEDDVWGSILGSSNSPRPSDSARGSVSSASTPRVQSPVPTSPSAPRIQPPGGSTLNPSLRTLAGPKPAPTRPSSTPLSAPPRTNMSTNSSFTLQPRQTPMPLSSSSVMTPMNRTPSISQPQPGGPNYNINLPPASIMTPSINSPFPAPVASQSPFMTPMSHAQPGNSAPRPPPSMGTMGVLQPSKPANQWNTNTQQKGNSGWSDFDPLL